MKEKVLVVCLSPAFQQTSTLESLEVDSVNRSIETVVTPSGKGINVSRVLSSIGVVNTNILQLGGARSEEFLSLCSKMGIAVSAVDSGAHIRNCVTLVSLKDGTSTEIVEENPPVPEGLNRDVEEAFLSQIPHHDALIVTGSMARGFSDMLFADMTRKAKEMGKLVVLDIRGEALKNAISSRPDVIKPNIGEFLETFGNERREGESEDGFVQRKSSELYSGYGIRTVLTRGGDPTLCFDGEKLRMIDVPHVDAVNTVGCGDTFTAHLTKALLSGHCLADAVLIAGSASSARAARKELV